MNLPTSLFPSIDLTYIEDKYAGLSTQALLKAVSSLKGDGVSSTPLHKYNDTKVGNLYFILFVPLDMGFSLLPGCFFLKL
jgi:hypothetical protein